MYSEMTYCTQNRQKYQNNIKQAEKTLYRSESKFLNVKIKLFNKMMYHQKQRQDYQFKSTAKTTEIDVFLF